MSKRKKRSKSQRRRKQLRFGKFNGKAEPLEPRQLLTAVSGTENNDAFVVTDTTTKLGAQEAEAYSQSENLQLTGLAGDDTFSINKKPAVPSMSVDGGVGSDTLDFSKFREEVEVHLDASGKIDDVFLDTVDVLRIQTTGIEIVKGDDSSQHDNILDTSDYSQNLVFTIKDASRVNNEVVVSKPDGTTLISFFNVSEIISGSGDDLFKFEEDATLKFKIDGGGGDNTLDYEDSEVRIKTTLPEPNSDSTLSPFPERIENIRHITGGTDSPFLGGRASGNEITGNSQGNTIVGGDNNDTLTGGDGNDTIQGGAGNDRLTSGDAPNFDQMVGGAGDDTYVFTLTDIEQLDPDDVAELPGNEEGSMDTLDLSQIPAEVNGVPISLEFEIGDTEGGSGILGRWRIGTESDFLFEQGDADGQLTTQSAVQNFEKIIVGEGAASFKFLDGHSWNDRVQVETPNVDAANFVDLDLSAIDYDLLISIAENGQVILVPAEPDGKGFFKAAEIFQDEKVSPVVVDRVRNLTGGQGNNIFTVAKNGGLVNQGELIGGAPNQLPTKSNIVDYSDYDVPVRVNLTADDIQFSQNPTTVQPLAGPVNFPLQERWKFTVDAKAGEIVFSIGDKQGTASFRDETRQEENLPADLINAQDTQFVHDALAEVIDRSDFRVLKQVVDNKTEWIALFSEPERVIDTNDTELFSQVDVSSTQGTAAQKERPVAGMPRADRVYDVHTEATGGSLQLNVSFEDIANLVGPGAANSFLSSAVINVGDKPEDVRDKLQAEIDKHVFVHINGEKTRAKNPGVKFDVNPKVIVTGPGTPAFPYRITFANMGNVTLTASDESLSVDDPVDSAAQLSVIPQGSATGFEMISKITDVIGSSKEDRIYQDNSAPVKVAEFNGVTLAGMDTIADRNTLTITRSERLDLFTGQAIRYGSNAPINGLINDRVYFTEVNQTEVGDEYISEIRFFLTQDGSIKGAPDKLIEISVPNESTAEHTHRFDRVRIGDGGEGRDFQFATPNSGGHALFGGSGRDVLVGSAGADYLSGGAGEDAIYTDGARNGNSGRDLVEGGDNADSIYSFTGPNHLIGGSGNDQIFSGSGDLVEAGPGNDTLTLVNGQADAYDILNSGPDDDTFEFRGGFGIASLRPESGRDTVDLTESSSNYVHILSNGTLFSAPGSLDDDVITFADDTRLNLGTKLNELEGTTVSPGHVVTELGFGFHQRHQGEAGTDGGNARIVAIEAIEDGTKTYSEINFQLWVDRGNRRQVFSINFAGGEFNRAELKDQIELALHQGVFDRAPASDSTAASELQQVGLSVDTSENFLRITATPNGTRSDGALVPAEMELTVAQSHTVVAAGENFNALEKIQLGDGANTFVFGNDYWGTRDYANLFFQSLPLTDIIARNLQSELTIDTQDLLDEQSPLTLDFRAVNEELRFNFSPIEGNPDAVELTVTKVTDLNLPIYDFGPTTFEQKIVFSHVDKRAVLYGGRYKNTFNFDKGATFQGKLIGGEGGDYGGILTFPGRNIDKLRDTVELAENVLFDLSLSAASDAFFQVENVISYSNPFSGGFTGSAGSDAAQLLTYVNLQDLKENSLNGEEISINDQLAGNIHGLDLFGPLIDKVADTKGWTTTGITGNTENTEDALLGDIIVRSGINVVRGTDYTPFLDQGDSDPFAFINSGADNISVGDNILSVTPGFHLLAGGTGADTYSFRSQYWGSALILDDVGSLDISAGSGGDALIDAIVPQDTIDFSGMYQDLHFTVFSLSFNDIQAIENLISENGVGVGYPLDIGSTVVAITGFDPSPDDSATNQDLSINNILVQGKIGQGNVALALGVENIVGSRGKNTVTFYDGAEVNGRISPGFGGSLAMNYDLFHRAVNTDNDGAYVDLDSSGFDATFIPDISEELGLPDWAKTLGASLTYQYGQATGSGGGRLGIAVGGDLKGSSKSDVLLGNSNDSNIDGADGDDRLFGDGGADTLIGGDGNDFLHGGIGHDLFDTGLGNDDVLGESGETYFLSTTDDVLVVANLEFTSPTLGTNLSTTDANSVPHSDWSNPTVRRYRQELSLDAGQTELNLTFGDETLSFDTAAANFDILNAIQSFEEIVGARFYDTGGSPPPPLGDGTPSNPWKIEWDRKIDATTLLAAANTATGLTLVERDSILGISNITIAKTAGDRTFDLPQQAFLDLDDSKHQTITINPTGLSNAEYHIDLDANDALDLKGYDAAKTTISALDLADGKTRQTVTYYGSFVDASSGTNPILTLTITGKGEEIWEGDFNFTREEPISATESGTTAGDIDIETADITTALVDAVKAQWEAVATGDVAAVSERLDEYSFVVLDLPGNVLGQASDGTIAIDINAAGHGWFIDSTPADASDLPADKYDLLTVISHEFGHALGLEHNETAGDLLNATLDVGTRPSISLTPEQAAALPTTPHGGNALAELSDEEKLEHGLTAFADWTSNFDVEITDMLSGGIDVPFVDLGLDSLWDATGGVVADRLNAGINSDILTVFQTGEQISADDLLALDSVSPSKSGRLSEFQVDFEVTSTSTDLQLDLELLADLGLDLTSFAELTQSEPIHVEATIDVRFDFGLDATGDFFVEDPTLVGTVTVGHENPLDVSLSVGPIGVGIEQGTLDIQAGFLLPSDGRAHLQADGETLDASNITLALPKFDPESYFNVSLPLALQGALATDLGQIAGSFNSPDGIPAVGMDAISASDFFTHISSTIEFDGPEWGRLLDLSNVSLDQALEGIKTALSSAIDEDGAAYKSLPFINQSAVDLLGDGSVDVVQSIVDAIGVVQDNLSDINRFEIDLNQEINRVLALNLDLEQFSDVKLLSFGDVDGGDFALQSSDDVENKTDPIEFDADPEVMAQRIEDAVNTVTGEVVVNVVPAGGNDYRLIFSAPDTLDVESLSVVESNLTGTTPTAILSPESSDLFNLDLAYESLVTVSPNLNGQSSNDDIAVALAERDDPSLFESLAVDRDVAGADERLSALSLGVQSTDADIAIAVASGADYQADYTQALAHRQTLVDDHVLAQQVGETSFAEAIKALSHLGLNETNTNEDIDALLNTDDQLTSAMESKDILLDAASTDDQKRVARVNLSRFGTSIDQLIEDGATESEIDDHITNTVNRDDEITAAKTSLLVAQSAAQSLKDAAQALGELGLNYESEDFGVAIAIVGVETVESLYEDRDLLQEYVAGTIMAELESLEDIETASVVSGDGTAASPWTVEYAFAATATPQALTSLGTNVVLGTQSEDAGTFTQTVHLADAFEVQFNGATFTPDNNAATTLATSLSGQSEIASAEIVGGFGTPEDPWSIEYTSDAEQLPTADDTLTSNDSNVLVGDRVELRSQYQQSLSLAASATSVDVTFEGHEVTAQVDQTYTELVTITGLPETFEIYWGETKAEINFETAAEELSTFLRNQFNDLANVEVTGAAGQYVVSYSHANPGVTTVLTPTSTDEDAPAPEESVVTVGVRQANDMRPALGQELQKQLSQLGQVSSVSITGNGTSANPWFATYESADFAGGIAAGIASTQTGVSVDPAIKTATTYHQTLALSDQFQLSLGVDGTPLDIVTEKADVSATADALARLQAQSSSLAPSSSIGDIARTIIDTSATGDYELRKIDRDVMAHFDAVKTIDVEYQDSVFDISIGLEKAIQGDYDLNFNLDDIDGIGALISDNGFIELDFESDGQVHVDADFGLDLNFTFDLSSLGNPSMLIYDDSQVRFEKFVVETLEPIQASAGLVIGGVKTVGLEVVDAEIDVDLTGSISLVDDPEDHAHKVSELAGNLDLWTIDLVGDLNVDIPMYFPTDSFPLGGTTADLDGNGVPDNVLHADGQFRGTNDFDFNLVTPDLVSFEGLFNLLRDPQKLLSGMTSFFDGVNDIADGLANVDIPLIGSDAFEGLGEQIESLEKFVMGDRTLTPFIYDDLETAAPIDYSNSVTYSGNALGTYFQNEIAAGNDDIFQTIIRRIQNQIYDGLKDFDSDYFSFLVPVYDSEGNVQFDESGKILTTRPESADDVQLIINDGNITFNLMFGGVLVGEFNADTGEKTPSEIPIDFDAGIPGLNLKVDAGINTLIDYQMGLGLGFSPTDFVYLDTSGINEAGEEISFDVEASLTPGFEANGTLGFLGMDFLDPPDDPDSRTGLFGHLGVDLSDADGDGKLTFGEGLELKLLANATAEADIYAEVSTDFPQLPSLSTTIRYDQVLGEASISTASGASFETGSPEIVLEDVTLDVGSMMDGFLGETFETIYEIINPIKPVVDLLLFEVDFGVLQLQMIDIAYLRLPAQVVDTAKKVLEVIESTLDFMESIQSIEGGTINFGTFELGGRTASDPSAETELASSQPSGQPMTADQQRLTSGPDQKGIAANPNTQGRNQQTPSTKRFSIPLMEDPMSVLNFLMGRGEVDLFYYDLPDLDLFFQYEQSFPIFGPLNGVFRGSIGAQTNFDFGFDTSGIRDWMESDFDPSEVGKIFNGFYLDDHGLENTPTDQDEVTLNASIGAGASLGIGGLVEAGVIGGLEAQIGFDLNDKETDFLNDLPVGDGNFHGSELIERITQGPECLFDVHGELRAFLDAFIWVGINAGFTKITIFEASQRFIDHVIATFDWECQLHAPDTIATPKTLDPTATDETLTLRYSGSNSSGPQSYIVETLPVDENLKMQELVKLGFLDTEYYNRSEEVALRDQLEGYRNDPANAGGEVIVVSTGQRVQVYLADQIDKIVVEGGYRRKRFVPLQESQWSN